MTTSEESFTNLSLFLQGMIEQLEKLKAELGQSKGEE